MKKKKSKRSGRHAGFRLGELSPLAKFSADQIRHIRRDYKSGKSQTALAVKYKTSQVTISRILRRVIYRKVI